MKGELSETKRYGVIIDSTYISIHKKLVVYIRYACPIEIGVKTKLVGKIKIPDGTASTMVTVVVNKPRTVGPQTVNLVGLGIDGASVMFGRKTDVRVQLLTDAPMPVHVHCVAHRLFLACADAAKDFTYLMSHKDTLKNVFIHVIGSEGRKFKLESTQDVMNEPNLKLIYFELKKLLLPPPPPPLGNFADISYLEENFKPHLLRDVCTLCSGALVSDSLLHMLL